MPASLTLLAFKDSDLFGAFEEAKNKEGKATAAEVAQHIGIDHDNPAKCVGARFSWGKQYGWMENEREGGETYWWYTDEGRDLFSPKRLAAPASRALGDLSAGQAVQVAGALARSATKGSREATHATSRAWRNGLGGWKDPALSKGGN